MSDVGEPEGDSTPSPGEGGGITGFLTSLRGVIASIATLVIAISGLLTALNATGVIGGNGNGNGDEDGGEGTLFRSAKTLNGRVYFEGRTMYVATSDPKPLIHLVDNDEELEDVSLSGRVERVSGAEDYGAGFVCRYRNSGTYYMLSVLSKGEYNIVRYRNGKGTSLSRGTIGGIQEEGNEVVARCLGDEPTTLSLTVNGRRAGRARDPEGIVSGTVGVRVGSNKSSVTCRFDDVVLR